MKTSLFCPLQIRISKAMLEAEGGWGKYPKQGTHAREREMRMRESACEQNKQRKPLVDVPSSSLGNINR